MPLPGVPAEAVRALNVQGAVGRPEDANVGHGQIDRGLPLEYFAPCPYLMTSE